MDPACYRARFLLDIFRTIVVPIVSLFLVLSLTHVRLGLLAFPAHLLGIISWAALRVTCSNLAQDREAKQLGCKQIPRVVGKWPGNIDILLRMMQAFKTSYVLDVYLQLFEEYQCTTLNTRIFWVDNVRDRYLGTDAPKRHLPCLSGYPSIKVVGSARCD